MISPDNKLNRMPAIAGTLMLIAATFNIIWLLIALTGIIDPKVLLHDTSWITPVPYFILDVGFGGNTFLSSVLVLIFIFAIIISIIGGIFALRRRKWGLVLIGTVGAIVGLPILGVISFVLIATLKPQFARSEK